MPARELVASSKAIDANIQLEKLFADKLATWRGHDMIYARLGSKTCFSPFQTYQIINSFIMQQFELDSLPKREY